MARRRKASSRRQRADVAGEITQRIITELEKGVMPWRCNWRKAGGSLPLRHTGEAYQGINLLLLALTSHTSGYSSPFWMTYRQAEDYGGQVRRGEKSTLVVYYGSARSHDEQDDETGDDEPQMYRFLKGYRVFNSQQIDGLPDRFTPEDTELDAGGRPIERLQAFFDRLPVPVHLGGDIAAYRPLPLDDIVMPDHSRFEDGELWAATCCHEHIHASGAEHRLNRESLLRYRESREFKAAEELIAEIGAAMIGAHLGFEGDHIADHASYVGSWLRALQSDSRHIFKAAAEAQRAVDWLFEAAGMTEADKALPTAA